MAIDDPDLRCRLTAIWGNRSEDGYRYIPRASGPPGSSAWEVFDRKTQAFVTNRKAIKRMTFADVIEKIPH